MYTSLPTTSEDFEQLDWPQIELWYNELNSAILSLEALGPWLLQWSQLSSLVDETLRLLEIATTQDTSNEESAHRRQRFLDEIYVHIQPRNQQLKQKLIESGLEPDNFALPLRNLRSEASLYREVNIPLLNEEQKLGEAYMGVNGSQTVMWDGEEVPIAKLYPFFRDPDRQRRELAWHTFNERKFADRDAINDIWVRAFKLRQQ